MKFLRNRRNLYYPKIILSYAKYLLILTEYNMHYMLVGLGLSEGSMVHILDGKSEIGAHVSRNRCYLIC